MFVLGNFLNYVDKEETHNSPAIKLHLISLNVICESGLFTSLNHHNHCEWDYLSYYFKYKNKVTESLSCGSIQLRLSDLSK